MKDHATLASDHPELVVLLDEDEKREAAEERRADRIDARREEFDFERDCGARP